MFRSGERELKYVSTGKNVIGTTTRKELKEANPRAPDSSIDRHIQSSLRNGNLVKTTYKGSTVYVIPESIVISQSSHPATKAYEIDQDNVFSEHPRKETSTSTDSFKFMICMYNRYKDDSTYDMKFEIGYFKISTDDSYMLIRMKKSKILIDQFNFNDSYPIEELNNMLIDPIPTTDSEPIPANLEPEHTSDLGSKKNNKRKKKKGSPKKNK